MLLLMGGRHPTLSRSSGPLFTGSLTARWRQLSLTSSSEFLLGPVTSYSSYIQGQPRLIQVPIWLSALLNVFVSTVLKTRFVLSSYVIYSKRTHIYLATKVLTFTADNASNNDTLVEELSVLIPSFGGAEYRVRCFAHILNLAVKVCCLSLYLAMQLTHLY
jgi:hypothetical protein